LLAHNNKCKEHYLPVMPQANCCASVTFIQQMNAILGLMKE